MPTNNAFSYLPSSWVCTLFLACCLLLWTSWSSSPNRYFLDSKEDDERYFRIDEITGVIRTTKPLDREDITWHNITVMASEVGRYPGLCCGFLPLGFVLLFLWSYLLHWYKSASNLMLSHFSSCIYFFIDSYINFQKCINQEINAIFFKRVGLSAIQSLYKLFISCLSVNTCAALRCLCTITRRIPSANI